MTREEVIKATQCCYGHRCGDCPLQPNDDSRTVLLAATVECLQSRKTPTALSRELREENISLRHKLKAAQKQLTEANALIRANDHTIRVLKSEIREVQQ